MPPLDSSAPQDAGRDVTSARTANAAAFAVLKVAAQVEAAAAAAAAASASAAGLIELQLAEDAVVAASNISRSAPRVAATGGALPQRPDSDADPRRLRAFAGDGVSPVESNQVRPDIELMIQEMKDAGASTFTIAARLNRLGERTPRDLRWHPTSVEAAHLRSLERRASGA